ncbi:MAG: dual specificity protein phosphatase [Acidimicrobiales bacterium]|nr:dual specificity protein phosphatase [Acidimicrobiales bacterium]
MLNLHFITENLATGGDLPWRDTDAAAVIEQWRELGITHVVDNRLEYSDGELVARHAPEIAYSHIGVDDIGGKQPLHWYDDGVAFIRTALNDPNAKVLTHCHMGINRGPSLAYAAMLDAGFDPVAAISMIRAVRSIAAVGYAEDALDWFHLRRDSADAERSDDHRRLATWRDAHPLDVVRIIRQIRDEEAGRVA